MLALILMKQLITGSLLPEYIFPATNGRLCAVLEGITNNYVEYLISDCYHRITGMRTGENRYVAAKIEGEASNEKISLGIGHDMAGDFLHKPIDSSAAQYNVVDAGSAWPANVVGVYTENGTNNGRSSYASPNGYWLYHGVWSGIDTWFIGTNKGETEINSSGVYFFKCSSNQSPPLDTNYDHTNSALGAVRVTSSGGSPPPAPAQPGYNTVTSSSFNCQWSDISTAAGYKLDVSTSSGFVDFVTGYNGKDIAIPAGTPLCDRPTSQVVNGLTPGTTYYFRLLSYNGFGNSNNSPANSVATIPGTPVVQPATAINEAGFTANWAAQSGASSYSLFVSTTADFSSHVLNNQYVSGNYYNVTGLSPNTVYYYRVKASNSAGTSGLSAYTSVTTAPDKPVLQPAEAIGTNGFTARWQVSAAAAGYYLDVAADSSFNSLLPAYSNLNVGNVTSYQVNQAINPYTDYYLRVRAYNANGSSTSSSAGSVKTLPVAAALQTVSVSDIDVYSAQVTGNITYRGDPAAEQHGFCWNTSGNPDISDDKTSNGPVAATGNYSSSLTNLLASTHYYVRAYATNAAGTVYGQTEEFTTLAANTAPVLNGTVIDLGSTDENNASGVQTVSSFLNASDADVPANQLGIAINGSTGNGAWQYSDDGSSWNSFGAVSPAASLLLAPAQQIRYTPDGNNGETAIFTFRAWDSTSGSSGQKVDTSTNGGNSAFSSSPGTASLLITNVNDAPILAAITANLGTIDENTASTPSLISSFLNASDVDSPQNTLGIAVNNKTGNGTWQYSADGAITWNDFGTVNSSAALLLGPSVQIRYVTDGMNGETASFSFRTWDGTSGSEFGNGDTTVNGGSAAFSADQGTATLTVTDVNNAPVLTSGPFEFGTTNFITTSNPYAVSAIASMTDVDQGAFSGIAVFSTSGHGTWEYSDDGLSWNDFATVTDSVSLLLAADNQVRYIPDVGNVETATLNFRGWDQTAGAAGSTADTTVNGGVAAFSGNTQAASITVTVPVYTVSGMVSTNGSGLIGVTLNGLPGNPQTDALGSYTVDVDYGWSGTVTPEIDGYTFMPASRNYSNISNNYSANDYIATLNKYNISTTASSPEGGTAVCDTANGIDIPHGNQVTVTAQANSGYIFVNWTEAGTEVSTDSSYTFAAATDRTLVANFRFNPIQTVQINSDSTLPIVLPAGVSTADVEYQISVTSGVTQPKIQLSVVAETAIAPKISITTPSGVDLNIIAGTAISGPSGWNGTVGLPVISTTPSQDLGNNQFVIKVGLDSGSLNFSEPVCLYAPGQGQKEVKVIRNGTVYNVTEILNSNTIDAARNKLQGGIIDAKYVSGDNLYIWTTRFSEFVAFTQSGSRRTNTGTRSNDTLYTGLGVIVSIPARLEDIITRVQIDRVFDISGIMPQEGRLISHVFDIYSNNESELSDTVRITLPFDKTIADKDKDRISLCWYDEEMKIWRELDHVTVNWEAGSVTGEINHFTMFAVIASAKEISNNEDNVDEEEIIKVSFSDIEGHWAQNSITQLADKGCISGYPDKSFQPERTITRAEIAVTLVKAYGLSAKKGKVFNDTAGHWAGEYIATANACGIINGYGDDQFGPDDPVTREQLAVMIIKASGLKSDPTDLDLTDRANISDWAVPYVSVASEYHIISGYPNRYFLPGGNTTRAEAATIIVNALRLE